MSTPSYNHDDETLSLVLEEFRKRIRWHVAIEAALYVALFLGGVFWVGLLLDWMFEPTPDVRQGVGIGLACVAAGIFAWWGLRRLFVRMPDESLALLLERRYPELADRLTTAVDMRRSRQESEQLHPEMVQRMRHEAAQVAEHLDLGDALNHNYLRRVAAGLVLLALSIVVLAIMAPAVWQTYTKRLALAPEPWPRTVSLSVDGFQPDGRGGWIRKVPRNTDVALAVQASLAEQYQAPERISIRYRWDSGQYGRDELVRIGQAVPGRDATQRFEYMFERIRDSVEFELRGGDDRLRQLRIEVVERPKVTSLEFHCEYPPYLNRNPRVWPAGPRIELPEGSRLTIRGVANKPVEQTTWHTTVQGTDAPVVESIVTSEFATMLTLHEHNVALDVELRDEDGIASQEPFSVLIASKQDQPPEVEVKRKGIGLAVTANALLPLEVTLQDDYGIESAWMESRVGSGKPLRHPIQLPRLRSRTAAIETSIDLRALAADSPSADAPPFAIAPGDRLILTVSAQDFYNLTDTPHIGAAREITFEIVTTEDLVARLNSTEQSLRETFEAIADKLLVLYGGLDKLDVALSDSGGQTSPEASEVETEETGDSEQEVDTVTDRVAREASRLAENVHQMADETLGVAAGFDDLHAQILNNRIDNSDLAERLGNRIAKPLRELGKIQLQRVADRVAAVSDPETLTLARQETRGAITEVERLLREMQGLEDYNEVIALLRDIIRQQEQINAKTKEQQKSELRDLLTD